MLIKNITIINDKLQIKNQDLDIHEYGIYLLTGENGTGKSTLLKNIIFNEKNEIVFNCKEQEALYYTNRQQLFSYLPQQVISYKCKVKDYIRKAREDLSEEAIKDMLLKLNAEEIDLNMDMQKLSGGEKVKVALATVALKDAPFLFLDEPTNNLDESTVEEFVEFICEYAKTHTILIVSHDERLQFQKCKKISIEKNKIIQHAMQNNKCIEKNTHIGKKQKYSKFKIFAKISFGKVRFLSICLMLSLMLGAIYMNNVNFLKNLSIDVSPAENIVAVYAVDCVYGELNEVYCKAQSLTIDKNEYYSMVTYNDISSIASIEGIEKVVLLDYCYIESMKQRIMNDKLLNGKIAIIAQPENIADNFSDLGGYGSKKNLVSTGRYPRDNKNEVAISEGALKKYYNYKGDRKNIIGQTIAINNKQYTVTGITNLDIALISYSEKENYGYYVYSPDTYKDYKDKNIKYKKNVSFYLQNEVDNIYLYTKNNKEKAVLNKLMKMYPANNYYSNTYVREWTKQFNKPVIINCSIINVILFAIISLIVLSINKNVIEIQINKICDYENYYIKRGKIKKLFMLSYVGEFIGILLFTSGVAIYFSKFSKLIVPLLFVNSLIIYVPIMVNVFLKYKRSIRRKE